jgi:hypothetical protein
MKVECDTKIRAFRLQIGGDVAPAVHLDEIGDKIGSRRAAQGVKIGRGQADIATMQPAMAGAKAVKGNVVKGLLDRRADNTETIRRRTIAYLVKDNARDGACICRSEPFL